MSARDEQPVTVPPPAGEDDAYSATTKVGAMPAELMEKLRAEGLLPEEPAPDGRETAVPRPSSSLKRPTPAPPPNDGAPVPLLYSTAPPADEPQVSTKPPAPVLLTGPPAPLDSVETPVAFTKPTPSSLPPPKLPRVVDEEEDHHDGREDTTGLTRQRVVAPVRPAAAPQPSPLMLYAIGALVVILLIVALIRLSR